MPVCTFPYRVFYGDTDAGGVVYYAQYLRMFEQARGLYIEEFGLSLTELEARNCLFVCRKAELEYHAPGRLGDRLDIRVWIEEHGRSFLTFAYEITCGNRCDEEGRPAKIVTGSTKMVCCFPKEGKLTPQRIPDWVMRRLSGQSEIDSSREASARLTGDTES